MTVEEVRARKAKAAQRRVEAVNLRAAGATFDAIGKQLGISMQGAHQLVKSALKSLAKEETMGAERLRALELRRIDSMLAGLWNDLYVREVRITKDAQGAEARTEHITTEVKPEIGRLLLKCITRRCALLGLDQPKEIDLRTFQRIEDVFKEIDDKSAAIGFVTGENGGRPPGRIPFDDDANGQ